MDFSSASIGKGFILLGFIIVFIGIIVIYANKIPYIGKLPGDIIIKRDNFTFYFPLTTCILISVIFYLTYKIFK